MHSFSHPTSFIKLSQDLLYAVKTGSGTSQFSQALIMANTVRLQQELSDDAHKLAFWLNIYNAFVQIALLQNPTLYKSRNQFFQQRFIDIGGHRFSLDLIEHGILRRSQFKWGLGYMTNPFATEIEKRWQVSTLDYRIHFALNCGAQSCPPIAFYAPEKIEAQLAMATANYLRQEVVYLPAQNKWLLPAIFNWFRGDFGGKKGILQLMRQHQILPEDNQANARLSFKKYDWSLLPKSFALM